MSKHEEAKEAPTPGSFSIEAHRILDCLEPLIFVDTAERNGRARGQALDKTLPRIQVLEMSPNTYRVPLSGGWRQAARDTVEALYKLRAHLITESDKSRLAVCLPLMADAAAAIREVETENWGSQSGVDETLGYRDADWFPFDDERIMKYLGTKPQTYKGQLSKLAGRFPEIRRRATATDRERFANPRLQFLYSPRHLYEHTEGVNRD